MKTVKCKRTIIYTAVEVLQNQSIQQEEQMPEARMPVCDTLFKEIFFKNRECWRKLGVRAITVI